MNWKERFDEKFPFQRDIGNNSRNKIKLFITQELSRQAEEIKGGVEVMRKPNKKENNTLLIRTNAHNRAITNILSLLDKYISKK